VSCSLDSLWSMAFASLSSFSRHQCATTSTLSFSSSTAQTNASDIKRPTRNLERTVKASEVLPFTWFWSFHVSPLRRAISARPATTSTARCNASGCSPPAGASSRDGSSATGCGPGFAGAASPSTPPRSPPMERRPRSEAPAAAQGPSVAPPPGYLLGLRHYIKVPRVVSTPLAEDRRPRRSSETIDLPGHHHTGAFLDRPPQP
jgi:hypothetical protein